jgi:predicted DNA-binding transcriptional regulator YafY
MKRSKTQAERLLDLDRRLRNSEYPNCTTFAVEWEISTKTAQRDLEFLQNRLGAPLEYDALKRGYFYTEPTFMMPAVQMSEGELAALLIASRALREFQGTPMAEQLESVFEKLADFLPEQISVNPHELFAQFSFTAPPSLPVKPDIWQTLLKALLQKQMVEIRYGRNKNTSKIKPLHLANLKGDWYLFVQYDGFDNFRQIKLARIQSAKLLKQHFAPIAFPADEFLDSTFGRFAGENEPYQVKLLFHPDAAGDVTEREWHPKQTLRELKNGSVELEFGAKGLQEVMHWVLAWGRYCKVKAPKELKQMVVEEIAAMQA